MSAIELATELCVQFEGVYLKPYKCPAGKPTIGVGATFYEDGTLVTMGDPSISQERAMELLRFHLSNVFLPGVLRLCPVLAANQRALGAIVDFTFNLGVGRLQTSTLRRRINERDWPAVKVELMRWVRGGGVVLPGLVKRRQAEAMFF